MTQEALRMALEALEENHHLIEEHERPEYLVHYDQIISLLAKALAKEKAAVHSEPAYPKGECDCGGIVAVADYTALSDKYVALKAQRTWVGLTDEDWKEIEDMPDTFDQGVAWAQAKLKEKNT